VTSFILLNKGGLMNEFHGWAHASATLGLSILMSVTSMGGCVAEGDGIEDKKDPESGGPAEENVSSVESAAFVCCPGYILYNYQCTAYCQDLDNLGKPGKVNITYRNMQYLVCGSHKLVSSVSFLGQSMDTCPYINCPSNYCQ
jgi:hypothetical protein